jgi:serpin B
MRRRLWLSALLAAALPAGMLAGCSSGDSAAPVANTMVQNASGIAVTAAALRQAETGSEDFGLALLRKLGDGTDGNLVFSPQTLVDLLAMILPGAGGQTAADLSDALGTAGLDARTTAGALGRVDATARADGNSNANTLEESRDVWAATEVKLAKDYLATLDGAFGAGVRQTDFQGDPIGATQAIDDLVAQETHGYITNLFSKGSLDSTTRIVLTDAVYLNAAWADKFDPDKTTSATFHPESGARQQVSMMSSNDEFEYASGSGWQLVELPYAGGRLAMDVLLPAQGTGSLKTFRDGLSTAQLNTMLASMTKQPVQLSLPKFTTGSSPENLRESLSALGLDSLFDGADLTGMTADGEHLDVADVVEKAHIAVAENGTIAAAAAGGAMVSSARVPVGVTFDADHPFLYLIRDVSTGQLIFAGQQTTAA